MQPGPPDHPQTPRAGAPPVRHVPPTTPGRLELPRREPAWPNVFGILSTVLGVLAILQGAGSAVGFLFIKGFAGFMATNDDRAIAAMEKLAPHNIAAAIGTALLGAMHLAAGILLLRRRPRAIPTLLTWAVIKIFCAGFVAWVTYLTQYQIAVAPAEVPHPEGGTWPAPAPTPGLAQGTAAVAATLTMGWLWIYPVIVLAWLSNPRVRAHAREWHTRRAPQAPTQPVRY